MVPNPAHIRPSIIDGPKHNCSETISGLMKQTTALLSLATFSNVGLARNTSREGEHIIDIRLAKLGLEGTLTGYSQFFAYEPPMAHQSGRMAQSTSACAFFKPLTLSLVSHLYFPSQNVRLQRQGWKQP